MNNSSAPSASSRAFTLIEILTVVAIISVLMSLLLPAIHSVQETMRRSQAKNTAHQIIVAVNAYYSDYGKYPDLGAPTPPPNGNPDLLVGDANAGAVLPNGALFDVLRSLDRGANAGFAQNPRKQIYYSDKVVPNPDAPKGGFLDRPGSSSNPADLGCLFDPWGRQFNVIIDTNYDNTLQVDQQYTDFAGAPPTGQRPQFSVGVFSLGKDGQLGNQGNRILRGTDDVASW